MSYAQIVETAEKLQRMYGESDPFRLCRCMGIRLLFQAMGMEETSIKGFFLECKRIRTITVNSDLPDVIQRIITAHELGHAALHRNSGIYTFHEASLFDESSVFEKEANLFAAELLLPDEAVLEQLNADETFFSAAAALYVPPELLDFKFRIMKWKGFQLTEAPLSAKSTFLRNVPIPHNM